MYPKYSEGDNVTTIKHTHRKKYLSALEPCDVLASSSQLSAHPIMLIRLERYFDGRSCDPGVRVKSPFL